MTFVCRLLTMTVPLLLEFESERTFSFLSAARDATAKRVNDAIASRVNERAVKFICTNYQDGGGDYIKFLES